MRTEEKTMEQQGNKIGNHSKTNMYETPLESQEASRNNHWQKPLNQQENRRKLNEQSMRTKGKPMKHQ